VNTTPPLLSFGHGTADQRQLVALLEAANVRLVVDVRRFPGSHRHPHVAAGALDHWLPGHGIRYRWEPRLGGRRRVRPGQTGMDRWWKVEAFRAYAAHTRTDEFRAALAELTNEIAAQPEEPVAVMCSETLWWRCHRRLIADVLVLLQGMPVAHLGHDGGLTSHVPAAGARVTAAGLCYDREP
jgi:uncharacterized protein (DUF488 family)